MIDVGALAKWMGWEEGRSSEGEPDDSWTHDGTCMVTHGRLTEEGAAAVEERMMAEEGEAPAIFRRSVRWRMKMVPSPYEEAVLDAARVYMGVLDHYGMLNP